MLTLAFAQIVYAVCFQWVEFTGGDNGVVGVWPSAWASSRQVYYYRRAACTLSSHHCAAARDLRALRLWPARRAGQRDPGRCDRHRRAPHRWFAFTLCGRGGGAGRGALLVLEGLDRPDDDLDPDVGGLPGDGAGRRHADRDRPGGRRSGLPCGEGLLHAAHRFLAAVPAGLSIIAMVLAFPRGIARWASARVDRRSAQAAEMPPPRGSRHERCWRLSTVSTSALAASLPPAMWLFRWSGGRASRHHRPERSRQVDDVQHGRRPAERPIPARSRSLGETDRRPCAARDLARGVGRTFQIAQTFVSMSVVENVQMALMSWAGGRSSSVPVRGRRQAVSATRRWICSTRSACATMQDRPVRELAYGDVKRVELADRARLEQPEAAADG
jgi:hypothetical protein